MRRPWRALVAALLVGVVPALQAGEPKPAPAQAPAAAVEAGGGVLYGEHHAAILAAPAGWMFDNESGQGEGLQVVLYRKGERWGASPGVMYAQGDDTPDGRRPDLDAFIADDLRRMREGSPTVQTFALPAVELSDRTRARVVGYRGDRWGNVEAVAYIPQDAAVIVLALSTRSQARFDRDLPDFRAFVRSYTALDVTVRKVPGT